MIQNKKGQSVGLVLVIAIGVIVALVLFQAAAGQAGKSTSTSTLSEGQYTLPANGACKDLVGQELLDTATVTNKSSGTTFGNVTVKERVSSVDGLKRIGICTDGTAWDSDTSNGRTVNITYTYGPEGYVGDSGARAIVGIIILLGAIAIAVFALRGVQTKFD